jgi:spore germination protein
MQLWVDQSDVHTVIQERQLTVELPFAKMDRSDLQRILNLGRRPRHSRRWLAFAIVVAAAMAALPAAGLLPWQGSAPATKRLEVVATVPYWNLAAGSQSVITNRGAFTGASPWIYSVDLDGGVVSQVPPESARQAADDVAKLQKAGVPLMPTISNHRAGSWDSALIHRIIHDPGLRSRHVQAIVELVAKHHYAGVDIDYEELLAGDRAEFSAFIVQLASALHSRQKRLSVDVFAKTTDRGYDQRNLAQDYADLGAAADEIRIMAYDWHWSTSAPGAVAPLNWVSDVLHYAASQIPRPKIILGVPMYGYDWVGTKGELVSWIQAYQRSRANGSVVHWDKLAQTPWFTYESAKGERHTVWFENAYSSSAKIALAKSVGVGGIYLWLPGDEDDLIWSRLPSVKSGGESAASALPVGGSR